MSLCGGAPIDVWLALLHIHVQRATYEERDQCRPPLDEKHDNHAQNGAEQTYPLVVVFERGPPAGCFRNGRVKTRIVYEGIREQEKVGYYWCNQIQIAHRYETTYNKKCEEITAPWLVVLAMSN